MCKAYLLLTYFGALAGRRKRNTGYVKVLEALDEKYQKTKQMEMQMYLKEYFYKSVIKQGETYRQFVVRLETVYRHLAANNITLPNEVKGWLLLKKLALEALILTAAQGSLNCAFALLPSNWLTLSCAWWIAVQVGS